MYYRGANAALLLYDITNAATFESVRGWLEGQSIHLLTLARPRVVEQSDRILTRFAHRAKKELFAGPHHLHCRCQGRLNSPTAGHLGPRQAVTPQVVPTPKTTNATASSNPFYVFLHSPPIHFIH
jgi:hypothetical protein